MDLYFFNRRNIGSSCQHYLIIVLWQGACNSVFYLWVLSGKTILIVENNTYIKNFCFVLVLADSLMHRAAAAEMMYLLEADKKLEAIKLIEDSKNNIASG